MADEVRALILQLSATTTLMQSQLRDAEGVVSSFEKKGTQAAERVDQAFRKTGASAGQMRAGFQQLGYQMNDVATQFASGTKPMQIFAQQAGQTMQAIALLTDGGSKFGAFLTGGWGVAITAGITFLAPFIAKLFDAGDAAQRSEQKIRSFANAAELAKRSEETLALIQKRGELQNSLRRPTPQGTAFFAQTLEGKRIKAEIDELTNDITTNQRLVGIYNRNLHSTAEGSNDVRDARLRLATATDSVSRAEANLNLVKAQANQALDAHQITEAQYIIQVRAAQQAVDAARTGKAADTRATREATKAYQDLERSIASVGTRIGQVDFGSLFKQSSHNILDDIGVEGGADLRKRVDEIERVRDAAVDQRTETILKGIDQERDRVKGLARTFEDAFHHGSDSIWQSFKRQGEAVIAQLLARLAVAGFSQGGIGGAGGLAGIFKASLSSVFGGGYADGGSPPMGKVSLVGERGPELFVPKVSGTIVPNRGLGGVVNHFDLRGAVVTEALYADMQRIASSTVRESAPAIVHAATANTFRAARRPRLGGR